jgi:hypothetical protein
MTYFSPSNFLSELYEEHYLKYLTSKNNEPNIEPDIEPNIEPNNEYTNDWCFENTTLSFVRNQLAFEGDKNTIENNYKKHYALLRLIIYKSCKYWRDNDRNYIEFIQDILWILLEQEGISIAHVVPYSDRLYSLLSKPPLRYIFNDKTDNVIKISNTSVHKLLKDINNHICRVIDETSIFKYRSRRGGKKTKKRKYKNSKKSRKYKK